MTRIEASDLLCNFKSSSLFLRYEQAEAERNPHDQGEREWNLLAERAQRHPYRKPETGKGQIYRPFHPSNHSDSDKHYHRNQHHSGRNHRIAQSSRIDLIELYRGCAPHKADADYVDGVDVALKDLQERLRS